MARDVRCYRVLVAVDVAQAKRGPVVDQCGHLGQLNVPGTAVGGGRDAVCVVAAEEDQFLGPVDVVHARRVPEVVDELVVVTPMSTTAVGS